MSHWQPCSGITGSPEARRYDRGLLPGPKRDELLELWEVERYARDSFGDQNELAERLAAQHPEVLRCP